MNIRNLKPIALLLLLSAATPLRAQNAVIIQQMFNFPDLPADTAFETIQYDIDIAILNQTNSVITGNYSVDIRVDSIITQLAPPSPLVTLNPGDSLMLSIIDYEFTQPQFKIGNNIVVVWPVIQSGTSFVIDSLITEVFFVPFSSVGIPEEPDHFDLYPNPATDFIEWKNPEGRTPERVRIYDTKGQLVARYYQTNRVSIINFSKGVYTVELDYGDIMARERFVKF